VQDSGRKDVTIFFDGGVRNGQDCLKALAYGADAVLIGRPVLFGLACGGQQGVERVLKIVNEELKQAMLATGCMNINQARGNSDLLYRPEESLFHNAKL
jgi:isopentenyl diphosphate isomerase/L-lactate dehydrogenase-like FMN-dependent dehydrogenase